MESAQQVVRAIRGATTVQANSEQEMLEKTAELLVQMTEQNGIAPDDIISILFSVTKGLDAAFPAVAARKLGWTDTSMMCTYEIDVPGSLPNCIRVMMHIETDRRRDTLRFVYLHDAVKLRPDLFKDKQ